MANCQFDSLPPACTDCHGFPHERIFQSAHGATAPAFRVQTMDSLALPNYTGRDRYTIALEVDGETVEVEAEDDNAGAGAGTDAGAEAETDAGTNTESDTETNAETHAGTDTE